ncbi:PITH domain-containing protein 1 [Glycine soja]
MACLHDHSCEDHDCSSNWSLYKHIDLSKVTALNEANPGSVKSVFKAWEERLDSSGVHLESNEGDPELLVFIPFTSDVKIKSISIVGGADGTSPSKMRVFINREGIDFSDAQSMQAIQEWDLVENMQGVLEYQTRYSKFQSVANITLHFPENFGGDTTKIHYIGFKGEATQLKRDVVATIVYELMPNPSDHKQNPLIGSIGLAKMRTVMEVTFGAKQIPSSVPLARLARTRYEEEGCNADVKFF